MSIASEIRSVDVDLQSLIDPRFTIIVPAFKEGNQDRADGFEAFLYDLKDTSASYNPNLNHELIVFDDGSKANDPKDMTISIAKSAGLTVYEHKDRKNHGKGAALKQGFTIAQGSVRAFADADGSYSADTVMKLIRTIEEGRGDIAVVKRDKESHGSLARKLTHVAFEHFGDIFAKTDVSDTQAGAKAFSALAAEKIWPLVTTEGYAADRHALHIARRLGIVAVELDAYVIPVGSSHVKIVRDSYRMALDSYKIGKACRSLVDSPVEQLSLAA